MPLTRPPLMGLLRTKALLDSRFLALASALTPGGSLLAWAHFIEPRRLEITRHHAPLPDFEPDSNGLRVLHLSDLHFTHNNNWSRGIVKRLADITCDILVITGDLIHIKPDKGQVRDLLNDLPQAKYGRYVCIGNWDRWGGLTEGAFRELMEETGFKLLVNDFEVLPIPKRKITIVGVDDLLSGEPDCSILDHVPAGHSKLVLSHTPTLFAKLAMGGADLVLSGHTHGGQVRAPFKGAIWMPVGSAHYDAGWFEVAGSKLFVSRGIGTSVAPIRFLCRPEAALHCV